uniref:Uncharacterized protein n=1 Tax=Nelumbo nucifera TaxID=4432 RepID=A0A822Z285_NELNU|nr:TPA_asm: hypothetical protein HUJ06_008432 [Nelumbo nucifera]
MSVQKNVFVENSNFFVEKLSQQEYPLTCLELGD